MLIGCATGGGEAPPKDFVDKALAGYINGESWAYRYAYVDPTIETHYDEDLVVVFLPFKPKKPCDRAYLERDGAKTVMMSVPSSTRAHMLKRGTPRTLIFHFERKGEQWAMGAKGGKVKLTKIGEDKVSGKILARYNNGNWVAGNFTATVCGYRDLKESE
jgi:hypothetical protein